MNRVAAAGGAVRPLGHRDRLSMRWLVGGVAGLLLASGAIGAVASIAAAAGTSPVQSDVGSLASDAASRLSVWMAELGNELNDYAAAVVLDSSDGPAELESTFQTLLTETSDFSLLELTDSSGHVIAASNGTGLELSGGAWLGELNATPMLTPITLSGGTLSWLVARLATTGSYSGILVADVQVSQLANILAPVSHGGAGAAQLQAVLPGGTLLYSSSMTTTLHAGLTGAAMVADGALRDHLSSPAVNDALAGGSGVIQYTAGGVPMVAGYAGVALAGWEVGIVAVQRQGGSGAGFLTWSLLWPVLVALAGIVILAGLAASRGGGAVPVPALPRGLGGGTVRGRRRAAQPNGSSPKVEPSAATDDRTDDAPTVVHRGPPGADLHPGGRRRLRGRYEILEVCGSGGEGHVLRALDHLHSRQVAIKVRDLDPHDLPRRREILNEASVLLRMTPHPHASVVREDFIVGDRYYLVMDWIDGTPSNRLLAEAGASGLPAPTVLRWMDQVAEVLDHLHTLVPPIVHGDVKPGNVIVTAGPDGQAILVDFGISQRHEGSEDGGTDPVAAREAVGSPGFMAPEIVGGEPPTSATDIFGLAATTFTLLLGEPPRVGQPPDWQRIASGAEARLLAATFKGGLALDPARRPTSARAFITAVRSASGATRPAAPNPATVTTP